MSNVVIPETPEPLGGTRSRSAASRRRDSKPSNARRKWPKDSYQSPAVTAAGATKIEATPASSGNVSAVSVATPTMVEESPDVLGNDDDEGGDLRRGPLEALPNGTLIAARARLIGISSSSPALQGRALTTRRKASAAGGQPLQPHPVFRNVLTDWNGGDKAGFDLLCPPTQDPDSPSTRVKAWLSTSNSSLASPSTSRRSGSSPSCSSSSVALLARLRGDNPEELGRFFLEKELTEAAGATGRNRADPSPKAAGRAKSNRRRSSLLSGALHRRASNVDGAAVEDQELVTSSAAAAEHPVCRFQKLRLRDGPGPFEDAVEAPEEVDESETAVRHQGPVSKGPDAVMHVEEESGRTADGQDAIMNAAENSCQPDKGCGEPVSTSKDGEQSPPDVLAGVVAFVEVRAEYENRSECVRKELQKLGARTTAKVTSPGVTHLVFKDGTLATYNKAKKLGIHIVSVSWIEACRKAGSLVEEAQYPCVSKERYESPGLFPRLRKTRSLQPKSDEEFDRYLERKMKRQKAAAERKQRLLQEEQQREAEAKARARAVMRAFKPIPLDYYKSPKPIPRPKRSSEDEGDDETKPRTAQEILAEFENAMASAAVAKAIIAPMTPPPARAFSSPAATMTTSTTPRKRSRDIREDHETSQMKLLLSSPCSSEDLNTPLFKRLGKKMALEKAIASGNVSGGSPRALNVIPFALSPCNQATEPDTEDDATAEEQMSPSRTFFRNPTARPTSTTSIASSCDEEDDNEGNDDTRVMDVRVRRSSRDLKDCEGGMPLSAGNKRPRSSSPADNQVIIFQRPLRFHPVWSAIT